jgi:hypothetical protein
MSALKDESDLPLKKGLGKAELEFVASLTTPLYWVLREGEKRVRNGSAFFLDAGGGLFGVTAAHVIRGLEEDRARGSLIACQLGLDLALDRALGQLATR